MHLLGHISSAIRARLKASSQLSESLGSRRQVLTMESVVLNTLNFELSTISILKFLARFLKAARLDQLVSGADQAKKVSEMKLFAEVRERFGLGSLPALVITVGSLQYVAELTLQDYKFIKVLPSKVAAAVVSLTLRVFRQADWVRLPLDARSLAHPLTLCGCRHRPFSITRSTSFKTSSPAWHCSRRRSRW